MMRRRNQTRVFFPWERTGGLVRRLALHRARPFAWAALGLLLVVVIGLRERETAGQRRTRAIMADVGAALDRYLAEHYPGREAEMFEQLSKYQPLGRMASADEVAMLVLYLCSDESAFITGQALPLDGGVLVK